MLYDILFAPFVDYTFMQRALVQRSEGKKDSG